MNRPPQHEIVTDPDQLQSLCRRLREAGAFAFDTEFVGEDRFRPEICLLQFATVDFAAIVDPLAAQPFALDPVWELIADPTVRVIVHSGDIDLAMCHRSTGRRPSNVIDLQIAAGFLGWGYPISLARLVNESLGIRLHKSQTLTDWRKRPLEPAQIHYALEDVVHLPKIDERMAGELNKRGRTAWIQEECEAMCAAACADREVQRLRRLKGAGSLTRQQLAVADAVLEWRDEAAQRLDRPVRAVLRDHLLLEIARHGWTDEDRIRTLRGMSVPRYELQKLAEAVARAKASPPEQWPRLATNETKPEDEILIALLTAVLRDFSEREKIAYGLLCTRQDLAALVKNDRHLAPDAAAPSLFTGWRGEVVGGLIQRVLSGDAAVRVVRRRRSRRLTVE